MLQDYISRGKIPDFERLHQLSDLQTEDHLTYIHNRFLSTFPTNQSVTLNKIFDNLSSLQRQLNRFEKRIQTSSIPNEHNSKHLLPINVPIKINELSFVNVPSQESKIFKYTYDNDGQNGNTKLTINHEKLKEF
jgi:hypothetical protein